METRPTLSKNTKREIQNGKAHDENLANQESMAKPPDGGWGWVIVFSSLMCNMLVDGIGLAYGVLLPKFADHFQASKSKVALVGSLMIGTYLCAGPIVSGLVNKFGCRLVTVVGSVIAAAGFIIGSFSPNLDVLIVTYGVLGGKKTISSFIVTYGVLGGFGFGMVYLPSIVSVGFYFEKKRPIATGIAVCGSGIGTFMFAPLLEILSEVYDWKNLLMIMAGFILNGAVCGMLMRPLNTGSKPRTQDSDSDLSSDSGIKVEKKPLDHETEATYKEADESPEYNDTVKDGITLREIQPFIEIEETSRRQNGEFSQTGRRSSSLNDISKFNDSLHSSLRLKPIQKHEIIYSGSMLYIPQFSSHPNFTQSKFSILSTHSERQTVWDRCTCLPDSVMNILKEMLDMSLLLNVPFLLLCIGNIFACTGFFMPFYYLVDRALILGIPSTDAAFLLSIIGITNTVGRVLSGFLANLNNVNALVLNNVALVIASASLFLQPLCTIYPALVVFCVVFGLCSAAYISLTSIILCDLLGLQKLASAFGLLTLARGMAGMVFQATGNYDASFYFGGGMFLLGAVLHLMLHFPCIKRFGVQYQADNVVKETFAENDVES